MRGEMDHLFSKYRLSDVLENNSRRAAKSVDEITEGQFRASSDNDLVEHIVSTYEVVPLELFLDAKELQQNETQVDISWDQSRYFSRHGDGPYYMPGVRYILRVPFAGNTELWKCQPSTYSFNPPVAKIVIARDGLSGHIEIIEEHPCDKVPDPERLKRDFAAALSRIQSSLGMITKDVCQHNDGLRTAIADAVRSRRERLGKFDTVASMLEIPLARNPDAPPVVPRKLERRAVRPLPNRPSAPPEPGISPQDYEFILDIIRHEGRTFETTPATFVKHNEEELRDIILAHLNGHFKGDATGETFRKHGKTDIRIEDKNRAAFLAECKVWRGQAEVGEALDQLLGYLTWRDSKAALVFFNKDVSGFVALQERLRLAIDSHSLRETALPCSEAGEWRFRFRSAEDADHKVEVHVFFFNLFIHKSRQKSP